MNVARKRHPTENIMQTPSNGQITTIADIQFTVSKRDRYGRITRGRWETIEFYSRAQDLSIECLWVAGIPSRGVHGCWNVTMDDGNEEVEGAFDSIEAAVTEAVRCWRLWSTEGAA